MEEWRNVGACYATAEGVKQYLDMANKYIANTLCFKTIAYGSVFQGTGS
jgi:hypothetical protein